MYQYRIKPKWATRSCYACSEYLARFMRFIVSPLLLVGCHFHIVLTEMSLYGNFAAFELPITVTPQYNAPRNNADRL